MNKSSSFFQFTNYHPPAHKETNQRAFLEWFIGFAEADGSWGTYGGRNTFVINQQEEGILHYIRDNLGFGLVYRYKTFSRFSCTSKDDIKRLTGLFNGNLVLQKTKSRFWVDPVERNVHFTLENNGWLSGFIDGEGCFYTPQLRRGQNGKIQVPTLRFIVDQKGELKTLQSVHDFLEGGNIQLRGKEEMCRYSLTNRKSLQRLAHYLGTYPLRTWKRERALSFFALLRLVDQRKSRPWHGVVERCVQSLFPLKKDDKEEKRLLLILSRSSETARRTTA